MITVLFARKDSIYKSMGLDVWDIDRNAMNFDGSNPVIAHPPCRMWGKLSYFAKPRLGEEKTAFHAIDRVRQNGGILEHPAYSKLWKVAGLPRPGSGCDEFGGYTIDIDQSWFGHKARKRTWLYIVGVKESELPVITISFDAIQFCISTSKGRARGRLKEVTHAEREHTPEKLAKWLIETAKLIEHERATTKGSIYPGL